MLSGALKNCTYIYFYIPIFSKGAQMVLKKKKKKKKRQAFAGLISYALINQGVSFPKCTFLKGIFPFSSLSDIQPLFHCVPEWEPVMNLWIMDCCFDKLLLVKHVPVLATIIAKCRFWGRNRGFEGLSARLWVYKLLAWDVRCLLIFSNIQ